MTISSGTMIPALQYKDAPAAIEWLCKVLGFEKKLVVPGEDGLIVHSQLTLGAGMIMVGSRRDSEYGQLVRTPHEMEGYNTQSPFIYLDDSEMDSYYNNAKKNGAEILTALREEEYGGRYYSCKDPEGYLWSFGSYNPYA